MLLLFSPKLIVLHPSWNEKEKNRHTILEAIDAQWKWLPIRKATIYSNSQSAEALSNLNPENNWLGNQLFPVERFSEIQFCLCAILLHNFVRSYKPVHYPLVTHNQATTFKLQPTDFAWFFFFFVSRIKTYANIFIYANNIALKLDVIWMLLWWKPKSITLCLYNRYNYLFHISMKSNRKMIQQITFRRLYVD